MRAVEAAPLADGACDQRFAIGRARNVGLEELGLATGALNKPCRFLSAAGRDIGHQHPGPFACQHQGSRSSDTAAARTGD